MSSAASLVCSADNLKILASVANDLLLHDSPEEIIDEICKQLSSHLGLEIYLVYLLDKERGDLRVRYGTITELSHDCLKEDGVLCHCRRPDQPAVVVDSLRHPDCPGRSIFEPCGMTAFTCV